MTTKSTLSSFTVWAITYSHQFRHTLGTRFQLRVPQHIVQMLLGHARPNMTEHHARVHEATVRDQLLSVTGSADEGFAGNDDPESGFHRLDDGLIGALTR